MTQAALLGAGGERGEPRAGHIRQLMVDKRMEARAYTRQAGEDAPEIRDWAWPGRG